MLNPQNPTVHDLPNNWQVFDTAKQVAEQAVESILSIALNAIEQRQSFHFVTAGGTTPLEIYRQLAVMEKLNKQPEMDWSKWYIYMGDERCLPADDAQRNSLALQQVWLNHSLIPVENMYFIPAELGAQSAALSYQSIVENIQFDVVLLGMGEDGHTASLFPGHLHENGGKQLVQTEFHSPKPPSERVTLSAECLSHSRYLFKLITGSNKQAALRDWLAGKSLPIAEIVGDETMVFISQDSLPITLIHG